MPARSRYPAGMAGTGGRGRPGRRLRRVDETSAGGLVVADDGVHRAARRPHRPHRPPRPPALVPAQGAHRGRRDPRGHRRPRGRRGDRHHRRGRRPARDHRLLVRRRRAPRAQDRAPLPAARDRRRPLRRRRRGDRGRLGAAGRAERAGWPTPTSGPSSSGRPHCWPTPREPVGCRSRRRPSGRRRRRPHPAAGAAARRVVVPLLAAPLLVGPLPARRAVRRAGRAARAGRRARRRRPCRRTTTPATAERPVRIDVARFEPRTVTPGAVVTVAGTAHQHRRRDHHRPGRPAAARARCCTSRAELAADDRDPDPATTVAAALPGGARHPGARGATSSSATPCRSADLRLDRDGVYPVLLNVNGERRRRATSSGSASCPTFVVQQPVGPARDAPPWPGCGRWSSVPHRAASGGFADDDLADSIRPGGRLDRAAGGARAAAGRRAGGRPTGAGPAGHPRRRPGPGRGAHRSWPPAPTPVDGVEDAGRGTDGRGRFLERLRGAGRRPPRASRCPTATSTPTRCVAAGLPDVVTRSLPGTPAGTAGPAAGRRTGDPPATRWPAGGARAEARRPDGAGRAILAEALDVAPRTDLAWAAGRHRCARTPWTTLRAGGIDAGGARLRRPQRAGGPRSGWPATPRRPTVTGRRTAARPAGRARRRRRAERPSSARPSRPPAAPGWPSSATSPSSPSSPCRPRRAPSRPCWWPRPAGCRGRSRTAPAR